MSLKPLADQVIVLTGASSGIGLATARLAAKYGAKLVLGARSGDVLAKLTQEINIAGGTAVHVVADVSETADLERLAATALGKFGEINTWINNAGVSIYGQLTDVSEEDSRRLFDVNFWGVVNGSLIALRSFGPSGGVLINIGSEVSDAVIPLQGMYSASKHAVKGFTDALRIEVERVEKKPIAITLIQPTAVNTPYPQHARNYMAKEPKLPDPKIEPEQVAEAILKAATQHTRDVRVGLMARINTSLFRLFPRVADVLAAKQNDRQHYESAPSDPLGTLYKPGNSGHAHERRHTPQN